MQGSTKIFLKQFQWEYALNICSSKNDYSQGALGTVYPSPGMHYENIYKYYINMWIKISTSKKYKKTHLTVQENATYCKCYQKKDNYIWNFPESRRKEFTQPAAACSLKFSKEIIYFIMMTQGEMVAIWPLTVVPTLHLWQACISSVEFSAATPTSAPFLFWELPHGDTCWRGTRLLNWG